jgi:hypothetical protein
MRATAARRDVADVDCCDRAARRAHYTWMAKLSFLLPALLLAACGSDPVSYSEPVTIDLKVKSSDAGAAITEDKSITTEQGNPYGAFVANARAALDGADPGRIDVDDAELFLGAGSTGVTSLDQVFAGNVDVLFQMNDTNTTVPVATVSSTAGTGPVAFDVGFDSASMGTADLAKLIGGAFKVVVRGPAAADFAHKGAEAELQVTFHFTAYP